MTTTNPTTVPAPTPAAGLLAAGLGLDNASRARLGRDVAAGRASVTVGTHAGGAGLGGRKPASRAAIVAAVLAEAGRMEAAAGRMRAWAERERTK